MTDNKFDCLLERLNSVRLERVAAVSGINKTDKQEAAIVKKLQTIRTEGLRPSSGQGVVDAEGNRIINNIRDGQLVRITNHLRDEHGIIGHVTNSANFIVEIRNETTRRPYRRAWWNLELIEKS